MILRTGVGLDRPNVVGDPYLKNLNTLVWISPSAFVANTLGTFGGAKLQQPPWPRLLRHRRECHAVFPDPRTQIRTSNSGSSFFNLFNRTNHFNFMTPVATLSSASFGVIQSAADPRILQLAAKFKFLSQCTGADGLKFLTLLLLRRTLRSHRILLRRFLARLARIGQDISHQRDLTEFPGKHRQKYACPH